MLTAHEDRRTPCGHDGVARNGYLPERELQTGLGPIRVKIPKVRAKCGAPVTFQSALVQPYVRKKATLEAALPWLYFKGVSSGEIASALHVLVGPQVQGLSASTVGCLRQVRGEQRWQSIRTNNPIESSFATFRHRTKRSKGCLSRNGMLHMMFKLG